MLTSLPPLQEYPFALRPMIAAHRGDTTLDAPENSLEAVAAALISGADMVELDVQRTRDDVFVCWHDEAMQVSADNSLTIHGTSYQVLNQALESIEPGRHLARLEEVIEHTRGKIYMNLEIKEYSDRDPASFMKDLEELLRKLQVEKHVLLSSFRIDYLAAAPWQLPSVIIQPTNRMQEHFNRNAKNPVVLPKPVEAMLPSELIEAAHATSYACQLDELTDVRMSDIVTRNLFLSLYTIRTEEEFDRAIGRGAMAIVCENPATFAQLRNKRFQGTFGKEH